MNFENRNYCVEAPHKPDTIILFSNGTFKSEFYGIGNYKIDGNDLELNYDYENGKAEYKTTITNKLYQNPKIIMNHKLNHYYDKFE